MYPATFVWLEEISAWRIRALARVSRKVCVMSFLASNALVSEFLVFLAFASLERSQAVPSWSATSETLESIHARCGDMAARTQARLDSCQVTFATAHTLLRNTDQRLGLHERRRRRADGW